MSTTVIRGGRRLPPLPLAGIDLNSGFMPVRRVLYYTGQPDVPRLQRSLSAALANWPDAAGRLVRHAGTLQLDRNDAGVRFSACVMDTPAPAFGVAHPQGLPCALVDEAISQAADDDGPLLTVKACLFSDGYWTLGLCNSHALCDGSGFWALMQDWLAAFHNKSLAVVNGEAQRYRMALPADDVPVPAHLQVPALPLMSQQMKNLAVYRSAQMPVPQRALDSLKQQLNAALAPAWVSTQDALMAVLWQALAQTLLAQGVAAETALPLANVLNVRSLLDLQHYLGNMAFSVCSALTLAEITTLSLAELAARLRADARALDAAAVKQQLAFMQQQLDRGHYSAGGYFSGFSNAIAAACIEGRGLMINNWSKFPAYDMDFSGKPLWFDLATIIPMHFAMVLPAPEGIILRWFLPQPLLASVQDAVRQRLPESSSR